MHVPDAESFSFCVGISPSHTKFVVRLICINISFSDLARRFHGPAAERALELSAENERLPQAATGLGRFPSDLTQRDAQAIAEILADAYLESAESAADPDRLDRWRQSAERAVARLAWLRALG